MIDLSAPRDERARVLERVAVDVAMLAADMVRSARGTAAPIATKSSPTDVVTATDLASEALIRNQLAARCPGSSVVGEEYGTDSGSSDVGWIVDPIDGTVNFLYDLPVASVSIAATLHGRVVAGAVADVHRGEVYSAAVGEGARCGDRAVTVRGAETVSEALIGTGFAYAAEVRAEQADKVAKLLPNCRDIRCMGSAALNLCWVGDSRLDGYYERDLKVYDYAAGALIAAEAGATVVMPDESATGTILVAGPSIFDDLTSLVDPASP